MSFTCEIENKLHQARLNLLNNHIEESIKMYILFAVLTCSFIETLDELEKHKNECEGEELTWTTSCFNRTLEEFNLIRESHPDIHIEVMGSDHEDETENPPETAATENLATEDIPVDQSTGFYGNVQSFSKKAIDMVLL